MVGASGDAINFSHCVPPSAQKVDLVFYSKVDSTGSGPNIDTGSVLCFSAGFEWRRHRQWRRWRHQFFGTGSLTISNAIITNNTASAMAAASRCGSG
jgi:hypothetical protein